VDEIVLSASLTQSLPASRARRCMVNALLRAARPANIAVRATGIQNREVLETATDLGVSRLQGDLVGPAVERQNLLAPRPLQQALHS
jgi:EAL domain-containing protein (putative c-di-GMP-specific phosphodiesterase class I)